MAQLFQHVTFLKTVADLSGLPQSSRPEIAFAGRSNVGKSSLINALTNQRQLAKASSTPGRTQHLNYFVLDNPSMYWVDMPGYGYAKAPLQFIHNWQTFLTSYLQTRNTLTRVLILIDGRRGVMKNDEIMLNLLQECHIGYTFVITKMDKLTSTEKKNLTQAMPPYLESPLAWPEAFYCSSSKKEGLESLKKHMKDLVSKID